MNGLQHGKGILVIMEKLIICHPNMVVMPTWEVGQDIQICQHGGLITVGVLSLLVLRMMGNIRENIMVQQLPCVVVVMEVGIWLVSTPTF